VFLTEYPVGIDGLVLGSFETREALKKSSGSRAWVTLIDAIMASGYYLRLGVIFKGKEL
jgi:hypothetical protein